MANIILRTDSNNPDFIALVQQLDKELWSRYGEEQSFYDRFNKLDAIKHVVVACQDEVPVGCGAIKQYSETVTEVKRMFVHPDFRGKGIAQLILSELEKWGRELNFSECILETGNAQPEAIRLYEKSGYTVIPNYGQYAGVLSSVCMAKKLKA